MSGQAQVKLENFAPSSPNKVFLPQSDKFRCSVIDEPALTNKFARSPQEVDGETVNLEIYLDKERPEYEVIRLFAYDVSTGRMLRDYSFDPSACPVGIFDFVMFFKVMSGGYAFVIKENIEVKQVGCKV